MVGMAEGGSPAGRRTRLPRVPSVLCQQSDRARRRFRRRRIRPTRGRCGRDLQRPSFGSRPSRRRVRRRAGSSAAGSEHDRIRVALLVGFGRGIRVGHRDLAASRCHRGRRNDRAVERRPARSFAGRASSARTDREFEFQCGDTSEQPVDGLGGVSPSSIWARRNGWCARSRRDRIGSCRVTERAARRTRPSAELQHRTRTSSIPSDVYISPHYGRWTPDVKKTSHRIRRSDVK